VSDQSKQRVLAVYPDAAEYADGTIRRPYFDTSVSPDVYFLGDTWDAAASKLPTAPPVAEGMGDRQKEIDVENNADIRVVRPAGGGVLGSEEADLVPLPITDDRNTNPDYALWADVVEPDISRLPEPVPTECAHCKLGEAGHYREDGDERLRCLPGKNGRYRGLFYTPRTEPVPAEGATKEREFCEWMMATLGTDMRLVQKWTTLFIDACNERVAKGGYPMHVRTSAPEAAAGPDELGMALTAARYGLVEFAALLKFGSRYDETLRVIGEIDAALKSRKSAAPIALAAQDEAQNLRYAKQIAEYMAKNFYPEVTQWKPLEGDLFGLLMQIDNMATGLTRKQETPNAR